MMQDTDFQPQSAPITGRKVLLIVLAFFGVIIAANMTMLYFAVNNFAGLVVKNSYVASQNFEADRERARAAPISNWTVDAEPGSDALRLKIADASGDLVVGAALSGVIGRRSHDREDFAAEFVEIEPGLYRAEAALKPSAWRLALSDVASQGVVRTIDFRLSKTVGGAS